MSLEREQSDFVTHSEAREPLQKRVVVVMGRICGRGRGGIVVHR